MVQFNGRSSHVKNGNFEIVINYLKNSLSRQLRLSISLVFQHAAETQSMGLSSALLIVYVDSATSLPVRIILIQIESQNLIECDLQFSWFVERQDIFKTRSLCGRDCRQP